LPREELYKIMIEHVQVEDDVIILIIPQTKTNVSRSSAITNKPWVTSVLHYLNIRSKNTKIPDRFFIRYEKGRCCSSPVGINTVGNIPSKVATFLKLDKPTEYTGHCFRRSSATLLANRAGDLLTLKRHGGWKSGSIAESYVEESLKRKIDVANMLTDPGPSTSKRPTIEKSSNHPASFNIEIDQTSSVSQIPSLFSNAENVL
jgi:integrase